MGLTSVLGVVALLSSTHAAMFYKTGAPCDFTDVNIDDEVFSRLIAKLPEGMESGPQGYHKFIFAGLETGGLTVHGLSKMRRFGPVIPFCTNGSRMVQVDLYSGGDMRLSSPWKSCSGNEGHITIQASFTRFTFQFRVVESTVAGVKLEFDRALPVVAQGVRISVDGAGHAARAAFEILSALLPGFMEELWSSQYSLNINKAFRLIDE
uniref:Putative metastriate one of each protein family n=1 Tax=Rhipicephalus pulchellus TaxID=72859 RepID=L7M8N5_RHIPC